VGRTEWRLQRDGQTVKVPVTGPLQSNEVAVTRQAVLEGLGIGLLPTYFIGDDLAQGRLVRVLPKYEPEALGIHAVYLSRQHQPLLLRAMLDFLGERFAGDAAPWDRSASPRKAAGSVRTRTASATPTARARR
jgi:DNA-binding transcriptional LysR family regulator